MQQGGSSRGQGEWSGCTVTGYEKAHIKVGLVLAGGWRQCCLIL